MRNIPKADIERYLRTGKHDPMFPAWPGKNLIDRCTNGDATLRAALVATVHERTPHAKLPAPLHNMDVVAYTREKVAPMVRGLFPPDDAPAGGTPSHRFAADGGESRWRNLFRSQRLYRDHQRPIGGPWFESRCISVSKRPVSTSFAFGTELDS
jgi:hypothetical protein